MMSVSPFVTLNSFLVGSLGLSASFHKYGNVCGERDDYYTG